MRLQTRCQSCGEFIRFKERGRDRFELVKKRGVELNLSCNMCNRTLPYHVNDIKAIANKPLMLFAGLIFVLGTCLMIAYVSGLMIRFTNVHVVSSLAGFIIVPYFIYEAINQAIRQKVSYFNDKKYG